MSNEPTPAPVPGSGKVRELLSRTPYSPAYIPPERPHRTTVPSDRRSPGQPAAGSAPVPFPAFPVCRSVFPAEVPMPSNTWTVTKPTTEQTATSGI